jgi:hypothetical protein
MLQGCPDQRAVRAGGSVRFMVGGSPGPATANVIRRFFDISAGHPVLAG